MHEDGLDEDGWRKTQKIGRTSSKAATYNLPAYGRHRAPPPAVSFYIRSRIDAFAPRVALGLVSFVRSSSATAINIVVSIAFPSPAHPHRDRYRSSTDVLGRSENLPHPPLCSPPSVRTDEELELCLLLPGVFFTSSSPIDRLDDSLSLSLDDLWTSRTGRQQPNNSSILTTTNSKRSSSRTSNSSRSSLRR